MPPNEPKGPLERNQTDSSLRTERQKTDEELAERRIQIEEEADDVVERARAKADETLKAARSKAATQLEQSGPSSDVVVATLLEQELEDAALTSERAASDSELENERTEGRRALASLLHLERVETNKNLLLERARADEALVQ
ncbi:MAG TPA: hypothetical protein VEY30_06670 [Myxococcaceae bacterium]|nr:hypothetical protein [Myxococcaceae bacterium]